ncbi:MAG: ATP-binding protein [Phycisphaerae bacterium]
MSLFYSFLNNIAIMLAVAIVHGFIFRYLADKKIAAKIFSGITFSFAVLATMSNEFVLSPGVVFDARSVVISICGMFAGLIPVLITSITAIIHRMNTGGGGITMGILVIISSALIGLAFHHGRKSKPELTKPQYLYLLGFIVHLVMMLLVFTLPKDVIPQVFRTITLPVLIILPLGTVFYGKLLNEQEEQLKTEQSLIEKEGLLRKAHDELELKVAERTEKLACANIRLKELDRLKSMFIASMSHELRTPLNSIIGFTGIMLQGMSGELSDEQQKQLTMVKSSAVHLLELINDVIDVSKIEAEKVELSIEQFDVSQIVSEVKKTFETAANEQGLELISDTPGPIFITSDKRRTRQVIINLVSNAIKFTDEGEVRIKVSERNGEVEISVADTGIGIDEGDMNKLFEPFVRIHTENRLTEGSGLGLYLSRKLSGLLKGRIKVQSNYGKGSIFVFILPLNYQRVDKEQQGVSSYREAIK